jgi:NAD+ synthase
MYKFVNYKMKEKEVIQQIINWLSDYAKKSGANGFVIGISGGIDSALTSTLAAKTGLPTLCVEMPIHQNKTQVERGRNHIKWLHKKFENICDTEIELTHVFDSFVAKLPNSHQENNELPLVNVRARFRMTALYYYAQLNNYLVVGTGNKVEDFGIGFFTKYGDGGVDISPIADLLKTEVYTLSKKLGINNDILLAPPTDGLWGDDKTDEEQIGASYPELEWAMNFNEDENSLTKREKEILNIYRTMNKKNQHKMNPIPVYKIPNYLR